MVLKYLAGVGIAGPVLIKIPVLPNDNMVAEVMFIFYNK